MILAREGNATQQGNKHGCRRRLQSPSRFSCDVDTGRQGPTATCKIRKALWVASCTLLLEHTDPSLSSSGRGWPREQGAPAYLKHPMLPSQPPGDQQPRPRNTELPLQTDAARLRPSGPAASSPEPSPPTFRGPLPRAPRPLLSGVPPHSPAHLPVGCSVPGLSHTPCGGRPFIKEKGAIKAATRDREQERAYAGGGAGSLG